LVREIDEAICQNASLSKVLAMIEGAKVPIRNALSKHCAEVIESAAGEVPLSNAQHRVGFPTFRDAGGPRKRV
jgi:hypothetical protein